MKVWLTHVLISGLACLSMAAGQEAGPADTIYLGGTVITMARQGDTAPAVAVKDGKVLAVGSTEKIRGLAGQNTNVVDLTGQTLLPGFYAAHDHFPTWGRVALYQVDLNSPPIGAMRTVGDIVAALREKAAQTHPGDWVVGRGYDDTLIAEHRHPTRADLDQASTDHPIWIVHTSGHLGVANSRALALAKIDRDTPQPRGGVIRVDAAGEPNGVIEESGSLVNRLIPGFSLEQRLAAIRHSEQEYVARGVTTTVIAGGGQAVVPDLLKARERGWLHLRAAALLAGNTNQPRPFAEVARLSPHPEQIRISGVKYWQDGSLQGLTGFLTKPYHQQPAGKTDYVGYAVRPAEQLQLVIGAYHRAGYQIAVHGNGDAAIDQILTAFRLAQEETPRPDARHRIEHCQTPREDQLDVMKQLGITPSFFVGHVYYWGDRHRDLFLGPERAAHISPLKSALDRGIRFTIHNDTPVTPVNPLLLVWCSVNRLTRDGHVLGPDQRIGVYDALRAVTVDAAWQNFEEASKGTIEVGKFADFVVLAENPLTAPAERIKDIAIDRTVIGGQTVYQRRTP